MKSKKLIEVAIPIKEISAESVRDKSIRHGHISTLHLWWARRPLPVCRAVIFASLIPDPLDEHCPQVFRDAVEQLLGKKNNPGDPYKPYSDIPWTPILDPMEDNLRNGLQMFIGKFSEDAQKAMIHNKPLPPAGKMLSDSCLIKWDNKNNEKTLSLARKLIFVAHNSENASVSLDGLLSEYNQLYSSITESEKQLFGFLDRHILEKSSDLERQLQTSIDAFLDKMPRVFDPFAGGGAIPLEASRLGCRSFGNDINPVAHIIQKGSLEFPQKYGKPILYSLQEFAKLYFPNQHWSELQFASQNMHSDLYTIQSYEDFEKIEILTKRQEFQPIQRVLVTNRLSFDVEYWAKYMLKEAEKEIGQYYPIDEKTGQPPIAYYWARVATIPFPTSFLEKSIPKDNFILSGIFFMIIDQKHRNGA